jgi:N-acyl-D-amino-acid deacylase
MTLLIRNVQIVGGEKEFSGPMDVFVNNGTISAIGKFPNKKADITQDGQGAYLSPGFIDINTGSDHYLTLFDYPSQEDFLKQGVTTIMGGMCGSSLAPLTYGTLESIQKWCDTGRINVNWHTMDEFLRVLDTRPLAVNFGTLAGHSTIRRALVGEPLRDLTKNEINVFARTLEESLREGAFGLSTGLSYVHARNTPYLELDFFADVVERFHSVYATHLRDDTAEIVPAVEETIRIAKERKVKTLISHFMPVLGAEKNYEDALALVNNLPGDVDLRFDAYPFATSLLPIYTFLPLWAQNGGVNVMLASTKDEWLLSRIKKDMSPIAEDDFLIATAPGNDFLVGKSLREIKKMYGLRDGRDALLKLMATLGMKGSVLYKDINNKVALKAIANPRSFIASNAPSFGRDAKRKQLKSEHTTSTFTKFLSLVESENLMPFKEAIAKITREPAVMFNLKGRGVIKEGNVADLVCFRGDEVHFTIVNGAVAESGGEFQNRFPGKALRHNIT